MPIPTTVAAHRRDGMMTSMTAGDEHEVGIRPIDDTPVHTEQLPDTPTRDRTIPATAWVEAPARLLHLGDDLGAGIAGYKRRIHGWLLWRAGPPSRGDARYLALSVADLSVTHEFRLHPDGRGDGVGPSGVNHTRFRTWKEDLRDHPQGG
jgi:hypothetical protein